MQRAICWIVALVTLSLFPMAHAHASEKRPNVLFLFSDDQRADTIAALGNPHIQTPNLDRLVKRGTTLTRAYCMGSMQGAVCVPSRAMIMSGRTLLRAPADLKGVVTWPEAFARAGYRTFMTGKWHNQQASALRCFGLGKALFFGGMGSPYALPVADISAKGKLTNKRESGKHSVELFADSAIAFLKSHKGRAEPFLAYVAFNLPHDPREAPKEYHDRYNAKQPPLPPNYLPQHPFDNGEMVVRDEKLAPWPRTPEVVRQHLADYYAAITFLDAQIGRILEALRQAGLEKNTIIVFASDHGLAIGSHGLFGKQNLYEHSMRSPLIFAGPFIPQNQQRDGMCYLLDIFPTLGDLCGVTYPKDNEGRNLVPLLSGKGPGRDALFFAYRDVQRAVRDERWKLIVYPQINHRQLFDLNNDPHETKDLAGNDAHRGDVDRMTALLRRLQEEHGDQQALTTATPQPREFDFSKVK
jgi:arylsulfatase A-like enzyme